MGLLTEGKPLKWNESLPFLEYVKQHGIEQFLNIYKKYENRCCDEFKWGDELEYLIINLPSDKHIAELSLRALEIQRDVTNNITKSNQNNQDKVTIHPEYGSFMIEATPFIPYGDNIQSLLNVERNMYSRKLWINKSLKKDEYLLLLSSFPMLGVNESNINGDIAKSQFISDELINPHPRFGTLTRNIRERRGKNVDIYVPIYRDEFTPKNENSIFMDAMVFGMGCCCLQVTHQCKQINEARHLYDQLAVLTPILMSLTASTPFLKGKISDFDCRWNIISQSVDDRMEFEKVTIRKSRYDTINNYLSKSKKLINYQDKYNDIDIEYDEKIYNKLRNEGIDDLLSKHIAHLFIRDPLVIYNDLIKNVDDKTSNHHFETIQSTNWQNVRFKPPPSLIKTDVGWRVEFRSMELQFTEFENAAFTIFVTLLAKAILYYDINLYIPISKVDANFHRAHRRDSARKEKFWWRSCCDDQELELCQLSMQEIICGNDKCRGLIDIVRTYLNEVVGLKNNDNKQYMIINEYLNLIEMRAKCELLTPAQWLREFVDKHDEYKKDSTLNDTICRDIIDVILDINNGSNKGKGLLPPTFDIKHRYYKNEDGSLKERDDKYGSYGKDNKLTHDWPYNCNDNPWYDDRDYNILMRGKQQKMSQMNETFVDQVTPKGFNMNQSSLIFAAIPLGAFVINLRRFFRRV